jgi:hypothetical protein
VVSLMGVPVGARKDLYEVEGMPLTAGSDLPAEQVRGVVCVCTACCIFSRRYGGCVAVLKVYVCGYPAARGDRGRGGALHRGAAAGRRGAAGRYISNPYRSQRSSRSERYGS